MTDVCLFHALDVSPSLQASSRPKWDNRKKDAVPGGVVALSPTIFVGIEHPSAANGAGERSIQLGTVSAHELNSGDNKEEMKTASFDVTTKINSGHVVHAYFDNWHNSASLSLYGAEILENDIVWKTSLSRGKVSKDVATGNIYSFNIKGTTPGARYTIRFKYKGSGKFEHPATVGLNIHPHPRKIICCLDVNDRVAVDSPRQASLVLGVSPIGQMRRAFLYYIERTRSHPSRMHLHYNSWYDIGTGQSYNESDVLQVMRSFLKELTGKRKIKLDGYLLDDGWDDRDSVWDFHSGFPTKLNNAADIARLTGASLGIWLSPWGGYEKEAFFEAQTKIYR